MQPFLSVVIPAHNEAKYLPACLKTLQAQVTSYSYEVIVVDNNSTDGTRAAAIAHSVRLVSETRKGVCSAREAGRKAANGTIIISTDADCQYPPNWLDNIGQAFSDQADLSLLIGNYRFIKSPFWANRLLELYEWLSLQLNYAFGWTLYVSAANLAFRAKDFDGYNTVLTQGGDELYVLRNVRRRGRVLLRFTLPIHTSSRRLAQGFYKTFYNDFIQSYLVNYWQTSKTGVNSGGSYAAHRIEKQTTSNVKGFITLALIMAAFVALIVYGFALLGNISNPGQFILGYAALSLGILSYATFSPHSQLGGPQPYRVPIKQKQIALTFDDGPNGQFSIDVADILERYDGKGSFFSVGKNVLREPEITEELSKRGHLIGNHSYGHRFIDYFLPNWRGNLAQTNKIIQTVTGDRPQFVRLPWLFRTPWLIRTCYRLGLQPVAGTFVSLREFRQPNGYKMARSFVKKVRPGDIIILHDGYNAAGADRRQTVAAVAELCRLLHADGYSFVRLDALL